MFDHEILADWEELTVDAKHTSGLFFDRAIEDFKESKLPYAAADVVALAAVMAHEYRTSCMGVAAQKISKSIDRIATVIGDWHGN